MKPTTQSIFSSSVQSVVWREVELEWLCFINIKYSSPFCNDKNVTHGSITFYETEWDKIQKKTKSIFELLCTHCSTKKLFKLSELWIIKASARNSYLTSQPWGHFRELLSHCFNLRTMKNGCVSNYGDTGRSSCSCYCNLFWSSGGKYSRIL